MVKKEIKSIILYLDSAAAIDYLTDEQAGILFKAVLRYGRDGQMLESSDTALTALFTMLCTQIDRDHKKYEERCERNAIMIIIVIMTLRLIIRLIQMMITLTLLSSLRGVWRTILLRQSGRCMESR